MVHNVDRLTTGNTKCELTTKRLVDTNCPRLELIPGEGDVSYGSTDWSAGRHIILDAQPENFQPEMKTTYTPASEEIVQTVCFLASTKNKNNKGPPAL